LKQNLELSERTDFVNLKAENERLLGDIERLKQKLREEISRTQAGVRLDLNLEKVCSSYYDEKRREREREARADEEEINRVGSGMR